MLKDLRSLLYYDKYYKNEVKQISSQKTLKTVTMLKSDNASSQETIQKSLSCYLSNFCENSQGEYAFLDLIITEQAINDFNLVLGYQHIEKLVIQNNTIEDVSKLCELSSAREISLAHNNIRVPPLKLNERLLYLDLSNNAIENFMNFSHLTQLRKLNLANNRLTQILNTSMNMSMRELDLSGNTIPNLDSLGNFANLTVLRMRNCGIKHLKGVQNLTKLTELDVSENYIKSLEPLRYLTGLKALNISSNRITQVFEVKHLKVLTSLISVNFENNPFKEVKFYKHIVLNDLPFLLEIDGKMLTEKEFIETEVFFGADLEEKKNIADKHLGVGKFEDNRIMHNQMKEFKDIVTEPAKLIVADFY